MRIVYMGTPDFAVNPLHALAEAGYEVVGVVTQPDKPKGRGKTMLPTPVKEEAMKHGFPVFQPVKVRDPEFQEVLEGLEPDIIVVAAFGQIIPKSILELPKYGCINIHASLLPKYRGAAPIQQAVIDGEKESGVTIMQMGTGLDTGDMIAKASVKIERKNAEELHDELSELGAELLSEYLPRIASGDISPEKQDDALSCYAPMISKEEGHVDFTKSASSIDCFVRGMPKRPGAYTDYCGVQMKIRGAEASDRTSESAPGTIIDVDEKNIYVACGEGVLAITDIQMPGKKSVKVSDYLRGNSIEKGVVLV